MSLFKTRDWWVAEVGDGEAVEDICDAGSLLAARLSPEEPDITQLVVGSFTGSLNIYSPQVTVTEDGEEVSDYRPDHLLLETTLNYPILQLLAGALVGNDSQQQQLCVLHPLRVVVYSVAFVSGVGGGGRGGPSARGVRGAPSSAGSAAVRQGLQVKLTPAYQHIFKRQAYSAVVGPFGNVRGKDFICVQSLDGCLSVYEQESFAFCVFLPSALLAGPLVFLAKSDAFATVSASCNLHCYKYQNLAVSRAPSDGPGEDSGGRRLMWDWEHVVGEEAIDMQVVGELPLITIVLLTNRAFYAFKETGSLKFVKRLEYNPACFTCYCVGASLLVCVATHTNTLLLYHETVLKWAAQLPCLPVAMARVHLHGIQGGLALVTGSGRLQVVYLGTDPSLFAAPPIETREINYDETDKELAQLHKVIKASTKDSSTLLAGERSDAQQLTVSASVGQKLEPWTGPTSVQDPDGPVPCCTAVIRLTAQQPINGVRVAICVQKPLAVSQNVFMLRTISDSSQVLVRFYLSATYVVSSLTVEVVTSFNTARGAPRVIRTQLELPLRLVVKASTPNKEADHKITISTNKPAVNLPELFPEFGLDSSLSSTGVGLQHYTGPLVTVLSSRTTHRYRLQADSLAALWVIFREMSRRLSSYWGTGGRQGGGEDPLTLSVSSTLPLNELYSLIDAHFLRRKKHQSLNEQLVQRCLQVRAVQRRLLTKFKDKNPTPLTNLDNLLDGMYKQVLHITDLIQDNTAALELCGAQLSCVVQLVVQLLLLHHNPPQHNLLAAALTHHLPPPQQTQGWEEVVDCSISYLLRSLYSGRSETVGVTVPPLTQPPDTVKLKKHISLLLDKMTKGGLEQAQKELPNDNIDGDETSAAAPPSSAPADDHVQVPLGSRLGEDRVRSARIRSARQQSARSRRLPPQEEEQQGEEPSVPDPQPIAEEGEEEQQEDEEEGEEMEEEEEEETPYQAAMEELDTIKAEEKEAASAADENDDGGGDVDAAAIPAAEGGAAPAVNGVTSPPNKAPKSAKGVEGPNIESPAIDIFGNPEQEDLW